MDIVNRSNIVNVHTDPESYHYYYSSGTMNGLATRALIGERMQNGMKWTVSVKAELFLSNVTLEDGERTF